MIRLALDLAGKTGFAIRYETGETVVGTWILTRGNLGGSRSLIPMRRLWKRLRVLGESHEIGFIVFEETFGRGAARHRLDSLQFATSLYAMENELQWMRVSPSNWKKSVVGNGKATREEYLAFARNRWPKEDIRTDDEAAARCLLAYGLGEK